jgi:hypothetical protein
MHILMIFVDGLGIGKRDATRNPMAAVSTRWLRLFQEEPFPAHHPCWLVRPTDATLGLEGIPQSATGQTTLLTGINAALRTGRHINGFCTPELASILDGRSLFSQVLNLGKKAAFANAYTPPFFEGRMKFRSVTTVAASQAGLPFRSLEDLSRGRALYQDFTNRILRERGYEVPSFTAEEAGKLLAHLAREYDFTLYEYFQTDVAAHTQDMGRCREEIRKIDSLLNSVLGHLDLESTCLVLTSDHGNIEDLSQPGHTTNPVPTLIWGHRKEMIASRIRLLEDVAPALIDALREEG